MPPEESFDSRTVINEAWGDENDETLKQNSLLLRRNSVQGLFSGYNYDINTDSTQASVTGLPASFQSNYNSVVSSATGSFVDNQTPT